MPMKILIKLLLTITYYGVKSALVASSSSSMSLRHHPIPSMANKVINAYSSCDSGNLNITVMMQQPFKGLFFAKDFSQECRTLGILSSSLSLYLPTSGCGVRLSSEANNTTNIEEIQYSVTVVVQQDQHLRQFTDQEYVIKCKLKENAMNVRSDRFIEAFKNLAKKPSGEARTGRAKQQDGDSITQNEDDITEALSAARAWMEIIPERSNGRSGILQVGEPSLLMVKSTLPDGIGWKVIDCIAHDGLGDSSQRLLDDRGCPLDDILLPPLLFGPPRPIALMRYQEAVSRFSAFKFPDRDRLHLSCGLQLCRGPCIKANCTSKDDNSRLSRKVGDVLDRFEVFNSVEVTAPGIEMGEFKSVSTTIEDKQRDVRLGPFSHLPGDRAFCVSPDKMAITFAILGLIFICAVLIAAVSFLKSRRSGRKNTFIFEGIPYYTRSFFSTSSSSSSGGSKLLLRDSPCIGHTSRSRGVPYGRVF